MLGQDLQINPPNTSQSERLNEYILSRNIWTLLAGGSNCRNGGLSKAMILQLVYHLVISWLGEYNNPLLIIYY